MDIKEEIEIALNGLKKCWDSNQIRIKLHDLPEKETERLQAINEEIGKARGLLRKIYESLTAPEEDKGEGICYNGKPCIENCNLDNCPVTGKWQD